MEATFTSGIQHGWQYKDTATLNLKHGKGQDWGIASRAAVATLSILSRSSSSPSYSTSLQCAAGDGPSAWNHSCTHMGDQKKLLVPGFRVIWALDVVAL